MPTYTTVQCSWQRYLLPGLPVTEGYLPVTELPDLERKSPWAQQKVFEMGSSISKGKHPGLPRRKQVQLSMEVR